MQHDESLRDDRAEVEPPPPAVVIAVPEVLARHMLTIPIAPDGAASIRDAYAPHFRAFHDVAERAKEVAANAPKKARVLRLELRSIRTAADKDRMKLKEDSLRRGKAIDGVQALLEYQLIPIEEAMEKIEKAEELAEAKRKEELKQERLKELSPYADGQFYDLGNMPDLQWQQLLSGAKAAHDAKVAAAAKAEADRIEAERLAAETARIKREEEAAERERMRAENELLAQVAAQERKVREEAERIAKLERAEAERKATEARAEADRVAKAEAKRRDDELAAERAKAKAESDRIFALADIERKKKEKLEADLKALAVAEQKAKDAEAKRQKDAAAAPDKAKVYALAKLLNDLEIPDLTTDAGRELKAKIRAQAQKFASWLETEAVKL